MDGRDGLMKVMMDFTTLWKRRCDLILAFFEILFFYRLWEVLICDDEGYHFLRCK